MRTRNISALKHFLLAFVFAFAVTAFLPAVNTVQAQAKTHKLTASPYWEKAPVMKKAGKYVIQQKKTYCYAAFVAPRAGTYKFTISSIKSLSYYKTGLGTLYVCSLKNSLPRPLKVKTEGGRTDSLLTASKNSGINYTAKKKKLNHYLKTRSANVSMAKGEKIYFRYYFTRDKCSYTLTVRKTK